MKHADRARYRDRERREQDQQARARRGQGREESAQREQDRDGMRIALPPAHLARVELADIFGQQGPAEQRNRHREREQARLGESPAGPMTRRCQHQRAGRLAASDTGAGASRLSVRIA